MTTRPIPAKRVIPTKVHGALDYATGSVLAVAPELLGLDGARASTLPPRLAGVATTALSALTDYELGVRKIVPMRVHLLLDGVLGLGLASAPWAFGSAREGTRHWLPHALVGANEVLLSLLTKMDPPGRGAAAARRKALVLGAVGAAGAAGYVAWRGFRGAGEPASESAPSATAGATDAESRLLT